MMRTYDSWKTTNPDDEWLGPEPGEPDEEEEEPVEPDEQDLINPTDNQGR